MKLVLANNQTKKFVEFHNAVQADQKIYDYTGYKSLLFYFSADKSNSRVNFTNVENGKSALDYDGVYINGYLNTPELATSVAVVLDANKVEYVNKELGTGLSLSKLTAYAKLASAGVAIPETYGGCAYSIIMAAKSNFIEISFPAVLKRADADRGIDNFKVNSLDEVVETLEAYEELSIWVLQEFVPNDGFYLVSFYHNKPEFSIFRALEERPDGNEKLAHMYKPKGGANAKLLEVAEVPKEVILQSENAIKALNRQIASVDSLYDPSSNTAYVLEVNYNPQLVTITTFAEVRRKAFLESIKNIGL